MKLQNFIIGLLVMAGIATGMGLIITGFNASNPGMNVDANLSTYQILDKTASVVQNSDDILQSDELDTTSKDVGLQVSVFDVIVLIKNAYEFVPAIVNDAAMYMNLPAWSIVLGGTVISLLLIFAIMNTIFERNT
jgi:hypothetical protein